MNRSSGSDAQGAGTIRRLSSFFSEYTRESDPLGSDNDPTVVTFECEDPFGAFAGAIRQDLAPRSRLERVLADRVVLSAWTLHTAGVEELVSIRSSSSPGSVEDGQSSGRRGSPAARVEASSGGVLLVVQCLEKSLDMLRRLREDAQPGRGRPALSETEMTPPLTWADTIDPADEIRSDRDDLDPYDRSNEWPVVPRGRRVVDDPEDDAQAGEPEETPVLAECWRDRLVFDLNVSEHSPVVKGTWVTVSHVLSLVVDGWTWSDILRTHPELNVDDIRTCLAYTVAESNGDT